MRIHKGVLVCVCLVLAGQAYAQGEGSTAIQTLTLAVQPISKIAVSGNPDPLIITTTQAASDLRSVQDQTTTYSVTTNLDNMKIVASISNQMPEGTHLYLELKSLKGMSKGVIDISNALSPVDVVAGIGRGTDKEQTVSYLFAADAHVSEIPLDTRVVTLTLTN